jgi:hypothetical protein
LSLSVLAPDPLINGDMSKWYCQHRVTTGIELPTHGGTSGSERMMSEQRKPSGL